MQTPTKNEAKQIFCPVNLPINYTLGLADAWTLLTSWKRTLEDFEKGGFKAGLPSNGNTVQDAVNHLSEKIGDLQERIDAAKLAYAYTHKGGK